MGGDDFQIQLEFVIDQAWRLLEMQDRNPLSPSHGCFHYPYWRDKTSEFPDARFQEAGAALGMLALPAFDSARAAGRLPSAEVLTEAFSAAVKAWSAQQYPDGCFDEWYKGERGFAATEFTSIAFGLAARFMGERMASGDRALLARTMDRAAGWLAPRHDRIKANHEAAAAAALALAWEVTGIERYRVAAREKLDHTLARQRPEGWFPEVGGMDLGYCSVLLDYVMLYVLVTGDEQPIGAMKRLLEFMLPHLHPDMTISPEMGLCLNPYVSRVGLGLLSRHDQRAAACVGALRSDSPGRAGLTPYLADDLRLARWSYLPVTAALLARSFDVAASDVLDTLRPKGWTCHDEARVVSFHRGDLHVHFAAAGGGMVRVFQGRELVLEDLGPMVEEPGTGWGCAGYDPTRALAFENNGFALESRLGRATFFYPSFPARLVLRLGCMVPQVSYWLRAAIDAYRLRNRTAVNQSAAPVAGGGGGYGFRRRVSVDPDRDRVVIDDRLESATGRLRSEHLRAGVRVRGARPTVFATPFEAGWVGIEKRLSLAPQDQPLTIEVEFG